MRRSAGVFIIVAVLAAGCRSMAAPAGIDVNGFSRAAHEYGTCSTDSSSAGFLLIDDRYVLWSWHSIQCPDSGFTKLFDRSPSVPVCRGRDGLEFGPPPCDPSVKELFVVASQHLGLSDLGLGPTHRVRRLHIVPTH